MPGPPPRPRLVKELEGNSSHKNLKGTDLSQPLGLPDKPSYLTPEGEVFWDEYCKFSAPGLLRLVHAPALAQLCEDNALIYKIRRSIASCEDVIMRSTEAFLTKMIEEGTPKDSRDVLPGGPIASMMQTEEGSRMYRLLNQIILRVQRQEQQFGLTPQGALKVDISSSIKKDDSFEDQLCG